MAHELGEVWRVDTVITSGAGNWSETLCAPRHLVVCRTFKPFDQFAQ